MRSDARSTGSAAKARFDGFNSLRAENKAAWAELWKGRIRIIGADKQWQALADAAFFYLNSSVHASSPASTSIFGLATWHDYHYYYGHVMWDIEAFAVPVLTVLQPEAAASILDYRFRTLEAARNNARLMGRRGLQFAWGAHRLLVKKRLHYRALRRGTRITFRSTLPGALLFTQTSMAIVNS